MNLKGTYWYVDKKGMEREGKRIVQVAVDAVSDKLFETLARCVDTGLISAATADTIYLSNRCNIYDYVESVLASPIIAKD